MNDFERVAQYPETTIFHKIIKKIQFIRILISYISKKIIKSFLFENITLIIIIINSFVLSLDDPTSTNDNNQQLDEFFLIFYSIEMSLKILAFGFLFNQGAYLRDLWNILDFSIVVTGYIPYLLTNSSSINLSALRSLRVLRPLRTISTVKSLRKILNSLFSAVNLLKNQIIVLLFFYVIFAIAGLQLFSGILKKRCIEQQTGLELNPIGSLNFSFCTTSNDCVEYDNTKNYICAKLISNPSNDIVNFDTFGWSFLTVFQIVSMEGWSDIMRGVQQTFSMWAIFYFLLVIFVGAFFLMNLTLAIISVKYNEQSKKVDLKQIVQVEVKGYDLHLFLQKGAYISNKVRHNKKNSQNLKNSNQKKKLIDNFKSSQSFKNKQNQDQENQEIVQKNENLNNDINKTDNNLEVKMNANENLNNNMAILINNQNVENKFVKSINFNNFKESKNHINLNPPSIYLINSPQLPLNQNKSKNNMEFNSQQMSQIIPQSEQQQSKGFLINKSEQTKQNIQTISNNQMNSENQNNDSALKITQRQLNGTKLITRPLNARQSKVLQTKIIKMQPSVNNFQGLNFEQIMKKPRINRETSKANITTKNFISLGNKKESNSQANSNQQFEIINGLNNMNKTLNNNNTQQNQNSIESLDENEDDIDDFLQQINIISEQRNQKSQNNIKQLDSQIETNIYFQKIDMNYLQRKKQVSQKSINFDNMKINLEKKKQINNIQVKKPPTLNKFQDQQDDVVSYFSLQDQVPQIKVTPDIELENELLLQQRSQMKKKKIIKQTVIQKKKQEKNKGNNLKRSETKRITKKINLQTQKTVNEEEFEADTFNPQYMKARPRFDIQEDFNYENIQPNKKKKKKEQQKQLQIKKIKQTKFNIIYVKVKKKISKVTKEVNLIEQYKTIPLNQTIRVLQMRENSKKKKKNQFEDEQDDQGSIKQDHIIKKTLNEQNQINKNNNTPNQSIRSASNSNAAKVQSSQKGLLKQQTSKVFNKQDSIKNSFQNKNFGSSTKGALKKLIKIKNKNNMDNPIKNWDLQKAKEMIFQIIKPQQNNDDKNQKVESINDIDKDDKNLQKSNIFQSQNTFAFISDLNTNEQNKNQFQTTNKLAEAVQNEQDLIEKENQKFLQEPIEKAYNVIRKQQIQNVENYLNFDVECQWSIEDILGLTAQFKHESSYDLILNSLIHKKEDLELYEGGLYGIIAAIRRLIKDFILSKYFDNFIMLCVVMNTVVLSLDNIFDSEGDAILSQFNFSFTIIFAIDMGLKLLGLGLIEYLTDKMNIFDAVIVSLSLVELLMLDGQNSKLSAFRSIRIFRILRVLRVTRLVRSLQFMKIMMEAISNNISSFIYILLLLFLFIFIYSLLGMQIFGGSFSQNAGRMNFDTFQNAALSVFQLMTIENWNDIEVSCLISSVNIGLSLLYLISWIFLGNYVLLNLLLAVIMDSFNQEELQEEAEEYLQGIEVAQDIDLNNPTDVTQLINQTTVIINQSGYPSSFNSALNLRKSSNNLNKSFKQSQTIQEKQKNDDEDGKHLHENHIDEKKDKNEDFYGIECQNSFFIFSQQNFFRIFCYRIVKHKSFETVILIAIFLTSIKLVIDTYFDPQDTNDAIYTDISNKFDIIFSVFFALEALSKSISFGFILNKNSYLREEWSQLDFFIVISSLIDITVDSIDLSVVKILRLLRTLRPLRFISHNRSMKLIVTALLESMGGIFNVLIVLILIWVMFAILAVNLMQGKLNYCNFPYSYQTTPDSIYQIHKEDCLKIQGAQWQTRDINFDNIGSGMLTLFVLSTIEGWPNYLYYFVDADESGPIKDSNQYFIIYFVVFIFIGSLFLLNLFVAIMSFNYNLASKKSKNQFLTDGQAQWIELQRLLVKSTPDYLSMKPPDNKYILKIWNLCESSILDSIIMVFIVLNIISMAMTYETQSNYYGYVLDSINTFFTCIFILEAILKIIAYGPRGYFHKGWNQFDFFVVMTSILDIIMNFVGSNFFSFLKIGPQIARVFRVFRVSRLFRLIKSFQDLQKLIQTAIYALPSLLNVTSLLFLVYFIFAILANYLFGSIKNGVMITSDRNFTNFHQSINLLFICSTGENWYMYMFDCIQLGSKWAILFFVVYIVIIQFVMMNLFVLIIIDQFEQNYINSDNPLNEFKEFEDNFKIVWAKYTKKNHGIKINERFLTDFYFELKGPQGFDFEEKQNEFKNKLKEHTKDIKQEELDVKVEKFKVQQKQIAAKNIMQMNILCDYEEGYVYFNELMFFIQKYALHDIIFDLENQQKILANKEYALKNQKGLEIIKKEEQLTFKRISINKKKQNLAKQKLSTNKLSGVNPIVRRLFVGMAFKSWKKYSTQLQQKMQQNDFQQCDISSESDTEEEDEIINQEKNQTNNNLVTEKENLIENEQNQQDKNNRKQIIKREHTVKLRQPREKYIPSMLNIYNKAYVYLPDMQIYRDEFFNFSQDNLYYDRKIKELQRKQADKSNQQSLQKIDNSFLSNSVIQNHENIINNSVDKKITLPISFVINNQNERKLNLEKNQELNNNIPLLQKAKSEKQNQQYKFF